MKLDHYRMICAFERKDWRDAVSIMIDRFQLIGMHQVQLEHYPVMRLPGYREIFLTLPGHKGYSWTLAESFLEETSATVACPIVSLWYPSSTRLSEVMEF